MGSSSSTIEHSGWISQELCGCGSEHYRAIDISCLEHAMVNGVAEFGINTGRVLVGVATLEISTVCNGGIKAPLHDAVLVSFVCDHCGKSFYCTYEFGPAGKRDKFYLTNGQNGLKSIPYLAAYECMPKRVVIFDATYGLSLRLHSEGGHCDDGLLICYPGTLARHNSIGNGSTAFKVKRTFQVGNEKNSSVFQKCANLLGKAGITHGKHWRGIYVYTIPINATESNPTRQTFLETSLTPNAYDLGTISPNPFYIYLGGVREFGNGEFLGDDIGRRTLGLDLLPTMEQENVTLFVARNCNCTMDAWFIQPTDPRRYPTEPELPTAGSNNCPIKEIDQTFSIDLVGVDLPVKIAIKAITDDKLENITVELLTGDKMDKSGNLLMQITIGTTDNLTVILPGTAPNVIENFRLPRKSHIIRLEIYLYEYCYGLALNGTETGGLFWPKHWWNRKEVKSIKLNGQMLLLEDPRVVNLTDNEFKNISLPPVELSLPINLTGVDVPVKIAIKAITDEKLENITLELLHGDEMDKDGIVLMQITTDNLTVFLPGMTPIVVEGRRLYNESLHMLLEISIFNYCYSIIINNWVGRLFWPKDWWNRKEVTSIKSLGNELAGNESGSVQLNGQMVLLEDPRVEYNKTSFTPLKPPYSWPIAGFREHSTFLFRVQLLNPSKGFKIIFSTNATFDKKTKQTAFVVQVVDLKRVELGGGRAHPEQANRKDSFFKAGGVYEFFISVSEKFYEIRLNGANLFENYSNSMPFCDIKYVRVEGDAVLLDNPELPAPPEQATGLNTETVAGGTHQIIRPYVQTSIQILMAQDGFYGKNYWRWFKYCPYYTPKNINIATLAIPPWTIDHITINGSTFETHEIYVVKEISNRFWRQHFESGKEVFDVPWKCQNFTQVIKKEGVDRVNYSVFVNITLEQNLKPYSEVRINFFNEALEFHDLFGSTVLRMTLRNNTLSFNSFLNHNKTWSEPTQNNSFTFEMDLKMLENNDVTPTTDLIEQFFTNTLNPTENSSYSLNSTIDQMPNSTFMTTTDQKKLLPLKLFFKIDVHETDGKAEFDVTLNGQDKDVNQKVLKYQCPANAYVPDIQYITVEYENITLAAGSEVKVNCSSSEVKCTNNDRPLCANTN
uniref:Galectin domain-containing protein n=1 Tax=Globodera rostochiensis TaxID=31243 RepID=A0A914HQU5_GLORO